MNETDISIEWLNGKGNRGHLAEMAALPNPPNADLKKGFTVTRWLKSTAGQSPWPKKKTFSTCFWVSESR